MSWLHCQKRAGTENWVQLLYIIMLSTLGLHFTPVKIGHARKSVIINF